MLNPEHIKHCNYYDDAGLMKAVHKRKFTTLDYVGEAMNDGGQLYEMRSKPSTLHYSSAVHLSCWILNAVSTVDLCITSKGVCI